jgi:hypothetical protein
MDKALIITSDFFPQKEIIINNEDYKKLELSNIFIDDVMVLLKTQDSTLSIDTIKLHIAQERDGMVIYKIKPYFKYNINNNRCKVSGHLFVLIKKALKIDLV